MKVFCAVLLFVASTAMAHDFLPSNVTPESLFKQTCISWEKVIEKASEESDCADLATADPNSSADIGKKLEKLVRGYKCFMKNTGVRGEGDVSNIVNLEKAIDEVAVSQEAADAIKETIKKCTDGATTVAKDKRIEMIRCGIADLVEKGTCTPKE